MKPSIPLSVFFAVLLTAPAFAQDLDAIGRKCAQSKLRAAGKECACIHKEWSRAVGSGELPDLTRCEEKITSSFAKAETNAANAGGACLAGESVGEVINALAAAVDKTLDQVGRGTLTPALFACDDLPVAVAYSGGNYSDMRKCVNLDLTDTECTEEDTVDTFVEVLKKSLKCPTCPPEEDGCFPRVSGPSLPLEEHSPGKCCIKADPVDPKKSMSFLVWCTLCISG